MAPGLPLAFIRLHRFGLAGRAQWRLGSTYPGWEVFPVLYEIELRWEELRVPLFNSPPTSVEDTPHFEFISSHINGSGCKKNYICYIKAQYNLEEKVILQMISNFENKIYAYSKKPEPEKILCKLTPNGSFHIVDGTHRASLRRFFSNTGFVKCCVIVK